MAGRQFLLNQAVLASSTPSYRVPHPVSGAAGRRGTAPIEGSAPVGGSRAGLHQLQASAAFPAGLSHSAFQRQNQEQEQPGSANYDASMPGDSIHGGEGSQDADLRSQAEADAKELADPIKALKSIFKQKPRKRRAPLELNPVMNKYRQKTYRNKGVVAGKVYKEDFSAMTALEQSNLSAEHSMSGPSRTLLLGAQGYKDA